MHAKYLSQETPIERYRVRGRQVFVKRDDLFGNYPAPPLGKLRGLEILLANYYERGVRVVGCWDTRVSKLGQGLAALVRKFPSMYPIVSYPCRKGHAVPNAIRIAQTLGAEVVSVRGNHVSICYSQVTKLVTRRGGIMLPFGLDCSEAVDAIAREAAKVPTKLTSGGTLVVCCGSGVTLAGLLQGLRVLPKRLIGLSSGRSVVKILRCVSCHVENIPEGVELHPAIYPYEQALDFLCPFPSHPNYDLKAWKFLVDHLDGLSDPILFWNVGA